MTESKNSKNYDLEQRTLQFAKEIRKWLKTIPKTISHIEDAKQVIRSSGSIGANYIEANEALSKKDFVMRIKICRKEAKETAFWLELFFVSEKKINDKRAQLINEVKELQKIFGAILEKTK